MDDAPGEVGYRPMAVEDLDLVRRWLTEAHVVEWWGDTSGQGDEATGAIEALTRPDQLPVDGLRHVDPWILLVDGEPVGFLESYEVGNWPTYAPGVEVPPGTWAIDLAIGEPSAVGRGLGTRLLRAFLDGEVLPSLAPGAEVWIDPDPTNERAVRSYRSVGFVDTGIDLPDDEADDPSTVRRLLRLVPPMPT